VTLRRVKRKQKTKDDRKQLDSRESSEMKKWCTYAGESEWRKGRGVYKNWGKGRSSAISNP